MQHDKKTHIEVELKGAGMVILNAEDDILLVRELGTAGQMEKAGPLAYPQRQHREW